MKTEAVRIKSKEAKSAYRTYANNEHAGSLEAASCQIFSVLREHYKDGRIGGKRTPPNPQQSHSLFSKWLNNNLQHRRRDWWNCIENEFGLLPNALVASSSTTDPADEKSEDLLASTTYGVSADKRCIQPPDKGVTALDPEVHIGATRHRHNRHLQTAGITCRECGV